MGMEATTKQRTWRTWILAACGLGFWIGLNAIGCSPGLVVSEPYENTTEGQTSHESVGGDLSRDASESIGQEIPATDSSGEEHSKETATESPTESTNPEPPDTTQEPAQEQTSPEPTELPGEPPTEVAQDASVPPEEPVAEQAAEPSSEQGPVDQGSFAIGQPCKKDTDCGASPYECVPETNPPFFPFPNPTGKGPPGGYCTQRCYAGGTSTCPTGSACYVPGAAAGTCLKECKIDADCRQSEGYRCVADPGASTNLCFPPDCTKTQPDGLYDAILGPSSSRGTCSVQPLPPGTKLNLMITITGQTIQVEFGSKPGSPLPVTWPLTGTFSGISQSVLVSKPNGCTKDCDGLLKGYFSNACLFGGTLEIQMGTSCWIAYDVQIVFR